MKVIYKYSLEVKDEQYVLMPRDAAILDVGHDADNVDRNNYVGTFQLSRGELVFHVFVDGV